MAIKKVYDLSVDLKRTRIKANMPVLVQGDSTEFRLRLLENGKELTPGQISGVTSVELLSGYDAQTIIRTVGTMQGSEAVFSIGQGELFKTGQVKAMVRLADADDRISTLNFEYQVISDLTANYIPGEQDVSIFQQYISDAQQKIDEMAATDVQQISAQLAEKLNKDTTDLSLNNFNEADRAVIQGLEPGTINAVLGYRNVKAENTDFFQVGKNLFNKDTVTSGFAVNEVTGNLYANASYDASDFIRVQPNTTYTRSGDKYLAFYDSNKTYISGLGNLSATTFTTPSNCFYLRVTVHTVAANALLNINNYQVEVGSVATIYEAYKSYIPNALIEEAEFDASLIPTAAISAEQTKFLVKGKNLFDKTKATAGQYINNNTGSSPANASYSASEFIVIEPSTVYSESHSYFLAFYDANKAYISGLDSVAPQTTGRTFTSPANAKYIRLSVLNTYLNVFQFEKGALTSFEPFNYKVENSLVEAEEFKLFLPAEICVAVGRTIEIYNNQVSWCGNINNYHFKWDCTIGKAMKRKFSVTGTTPLIGNHTLTLTVYSNNMKLVTTAVTTIKIVSATVSTPKNILTIGDSLTNEKPWLSELRTLSANQYTLLGTRGAAPLKHEGRSGWGAATYLSGASYTYQNEGVNPFWNGTRFSWAHYKTNSLVNPDAVQLFLGTNGMALDPTSNANNIKAIVDYIRQDDATIPIFVVYTLYRGNQNGIGNEIASDGYAGNKGAWELEEDRKVFNLMVRLNELLKGYTNLRFVPISVTHDSEYNFGAVSTPVNPRASQTELLPSQATHPQEQGYFQMADVMFSTFAKHL